MFKFMVMTLFRALLLLFSILWITVIISSYVLSIGVLSYDNSVTYYLLEFYLLNEMSQ